jgi:hypothetical protein
VLAFLASKTFLSLKSALSLHGVFWLYGSLGFIGFFVIYWTFSETEGRSLEEIEEFYKKGMRGKIPKREIIDETSKEPSINFSPSTSSVIIEKENKVNSNDEDRMIDNTLFATQSLRDKTGKSHSVNDISGVCGTSTETLDSAITASTVDLHDPKSSTGDVTKKRDDDIQQVAEEKPEETEVRDKKYKKEKTAEEEISNEIKELEGTSSESKAVDGKCSKDKTTKENNVKEGEKCIKEKVDVHNEADVEERTQM